MTEEPWWKPVLTDKAWCDRIRADYPDAEGDDEEIRDRFADGRKYAVLWDHTGDAYEQFELLADAHLALLAELLQCQSDRQKEHESRVTMAGVVETNRELLRECRAVGKRIADGTWQTKDLAFLDVVDALLAEKP